MEKIALSPVQIKAIYDAGYAKGEADEYGDKRDKDSVLVESLADILEVTVEVAATILGAIGDAAG